MTREREQSTLDVAIIGGGAAGCYSAYRLMSSDAAASPVVKELLEASGRNRLSVALYEMSDRIGGRLYSYRFPDLPHSVAEMGGMAFSPLQANVHGLCRDELRLEIVPAPEFSVWNMCYLRGHRFPYSAFQPEGHQPNDYYPDVIPYFLVDGEKWQFPLNVMISAFDRAVPGSKDFLDRLVRLGAGHLDEKWKIIDELDLFLREACVEGTDERLYNFGFWNILQEHASREAYAMATMSTGWYAPTENWNAYITMPACFIDFSIEESWYKLVDGYDRLAHELIRHFEDRGGVTHMETWLRRLDVDDSSGGPVFEMQLASPDGRTRTQRAKNVILAIPQRAVLLLDPDTFLFAHGQFVRDLSKVTSVTTSKLFLTFPSPWWRDVSVPGATQHITDGLSTTDLPLRVCYYLETEADGKSLLLASANDSVATNYWDGYLPLSRFGVSNHPRLGRRPAAPLLYESPPSTMVQDAVRQLSEMHGCDVPPPLAAAYVNWSEDPYGGGMHFWNPHERSWKVMPRIRRPVPDLNVFLCGEAFSAQQGWVEGALNTAEMMLETHFGMSRPTWVPAAYEFGP